MRIIDDWVAQSLAECAPIRLPACF